MEEKMSIIPERRIIGQIRILEKKWGHNV